MRRVKNAGRRYGRGEPKVEGVPATHIIKIGINLATEKGMVKPGKLNGLLICHDRLDNDNRLLVDYDSMALLGYNRAQVDMGIKQHWNAPEGVLPQMLRFVLMADAAKDENGDWMYPNTFAETYACYNKTGLFCEGDGQNARRKQPDGTKKEILCIPFGQEGRDAKEFCEFSGPGKPCKDHSRLTVLLYGIDANDTRFNVSSHLGPNARFRLDTSSEYSAMATLEELDRAATRLNGNLCGITGTISFQRKGRRTGQDGPAAKSIVGHVLVKLDEESIARREMERRLPGRAEALALGAPVARARIAYEEPQYDDGAPFVGAPESVEDEVVEGEPVETPHAPVVDLPFDAEPAGDDGSHAYASVDTATLPELINAAVEHAINADRVLSEVIWYADKEGNRHPIPNFNGPAWFYGGADDAQKAKRVAILRAVVKDLGIPVARMESGQ